MFNEARTWSGRIYSRQSGYVLCIESNIGIHLFPYIGPDGRKRVVFTGHSMGACLSSVLAYQIIKRYPEFSERLLLIQFGSPNYARSKFTDWMNLNLKSRIIQYVFLCWVCCVWCVCCVLCVRVWVWDRELTVANRYHSIGSEMFRLTHSKVVFVKYWGRSASPSHTPLPPSQTPAHVRITTLKAHCSLI